MIAEGQFSRRYFDEAVSLLRKVCTIPAPSHHEEKRVAFISEYLESQGIEHDIDSAGNVIIAYADDGKSPLDVYAAHTDVVFPDTDELPMTADGDIIRCPGIADDSANFAALLMYALAFHKERPTVRRGVLFVCNSCEEGLGNLLGTRTLFENYGSRIATFTSFDARLHDGIANTAVGSVRYRITVSCEGGHSFTDFGRPNAIAVLSSVIAKLYQADTGQAVTTYNVGTIEGGTSVNSIAQRAACTYEIRSTDEKELERMQGFFQSVIKESSDKNVRIETECIGLRPCAHEADTEELEKAAEDVLSAYGLPANRRPASTDCNIPLSLGIPAICFGLIDGGGTHTREEWADISSYRTGLDAGWDYISRISIRP